VERDHPAVEIVVEITVEIGVDHSATRVRPHQANTGTWSPPVVVVNSPSWEKCPFAVRCPSADHRVKMSGSYSN
jgi:hypothetical protein